MFCAVYDIPCMFKDGGKVVGSYRVQAETFNSSKMTHNGQCVVGIENAVTTNTWFYDDERKGWLWAGVTSAGKGTCSS